MMKRLSIALLVALLATSFAPAAASHSDGPRIRVDRRGNLRVALTGADETFRLSETGDGDLLYTYTVDGIETQDLLPGVIGDVRINGRGGNDQIFINNYVDFGGALTLIGGSGEDLIRVFTIDLPGELRIRGGHGDDRVYLGPGGQYNAEALVRTGEGADTVLLDGVQFETSLRIATGIGDDNVSSQFSRFSGPTLLQMRGGSDVVQLFSGSFAGPATFDGGAGTMDQFSDQGSTFTDPPTVSRFESITP